MSAANGNDRLRSLESRLDEQREHTRAVEEVLIALMRELLHNEEHRGIIRRALARAEWFTSRDAGLHDRRTAEPRYEPSRAERMAFERLAVLAGFIPAVVAQALYQPNDEAQFEIYAETRLLDDAQKRARFRQAAKDCGVDLAADAREQFRVFPAVETTTSSGQP